jgi:hypothetical protein
MTMAPDSGHLIDLSTHKLQPGYEVLPDDLQGAARRALGGRSETHISKTSGGRLSRWAAGRRKEARRKMAKESRKRNR